MDRRGKARMTDARYLMYLHFIDAPIPRELMSRVYEENQV